MTTEKLTVKSSKTTKHSLCEVKVCKWISDTELSDKTTVFLKVHVSEIYTDVLTSLNTDEISVFSFLNIKEWGVYRLKNMVKLLSTESRRYEYKSSLHDCFYCFP